MFSEIRRAAMTPVWIAQLATGTKSFERNAVIGSRRLNEWGLHAARVGLAFSVEQGVSRLGSRPRSRDIDQPFMRLLHADDDPVRPRLGIADVPKPMHQTLSGDLGRRL